MRYIIYGAGAVGGTIGAKLHRVGHDVLLIARAAHLDAIQRNGLTFQTPLGSETLPIPAVAHPSEVVFRDDDAVLLTMKTQHTADALDALREVRPEARVICAQNAVENERLAARRFARVYGMLVYLPSTYLEPGVVQAHCAPTSGVLDAGAYPRGRDRFIETVCGQINASGFSAVARDDIMRWKYEKLLANLGNAVQAVCGSGTEQARAIVKQARDEGRAAFRAAGIDWTSEAEIAERRTHMSPSAPIAGAKRAGGSTWQSLARSAGSIETDYLNGEVALLGRLYHVPTPANVALQRLALRMLHERREPGSLPVDEVEREIVAARAPSAGAGASTTGRCSSSAPETWSAGTR
jgi:2-dehydropantoate 2-reductase